MRVGVYIDGFNLYYGGRGLCGRGTAGWRWLDLRALAARVVANHSTWCCASLILRLVATLWVTLISCGLGASREDETRLASGECAAGRPGVW